MTAILTCPKGNTSKQRLPEGDVPPTFLYRGATQYKLKARSNTKAVYFPVKPPAREPHDGV